MGQVARFTALPQWGAAFVRGQVVVIRSHRGLELGEILARDGDPEPTRWCTDSSPDRLAGNETSQIPSVHEPQVLRLAGPEDLASSVRARESRRSRFALCQKVIQAVDSPLSLIDVEPLLDDQTTVIHYLGPQQLDVVTLRARFRAEFNLDVVFEAAGAEIEAEAAEHAHQRGSQAGCGSCGCGASGGSCTSELSLGEKRREPIAAACENRPNRVSHAGCASCGIRQKC
jgi:hypothetical protein